MRFRVQIGDLMGDLWNSSSLFLQEVSLIFTYENMLLKKLLGVKSTELKIIKFFDLTE